MSAISHDESVAVQLRKFSPSPSRDPDAGLRAQTHYERRLPRWRFHLRQRLIPIVRWETPYLAKMQRSCRSAFLDSYFAFAANLGTHTFFMAFLPICFWFGYPELGLALVHMLALGVYLSGFVKDLLCLPRPLSPPLQRITMSGSAALEYGFPSTHTTNAVSAALYLLYQLHLAKDSLSPTSYSLLCLACYCYALSITLGRVYCGMHGIFDVIVGAILGVFLIWAWVTYGVSYSLWIVADSWTRPASAVLALAFAVRFHPEPADNCPCYDDSVSFLGVLMGIAIGTWQRMQATDMSPPSIPAIYNFSNGDLLICAARLLAGIVVIFAWRAVAKPILLKTLPPTFRFIDDYGLMIPRRYFLQARDYKQVPTLRQDDNVLPAVRDIPSMLSSFGTSRRRRISIGPQSEADAREYLANRDQRRKVDRSAAADAKRFRSTMESPLSPVSESTKSTARPGTRKSPSSLHVNQVGNVLLAPSASDADTAQDSGREDETADREMFEALLKPRIRYDAEVITKLVVYAGIGWLAVEGDPMLFEWLGLA